MFLCSSVFGKRCQWDKVEGLLWWMEISEDLLWCQQRWYKIRACGDTYRIDVFYEPLEVMHTLIRMYWVIKPIGTSEFWKRKVTLWEKHIIPLLKSRKSCTTCCFSKTTSGHKWLISQLRSRLKSWECPDQHNTPYLQWRGYFDILGCILEDFGCSLGAKRPLNLRDWNNHFRAFSWEISSSWKGTFFEYFELYI